jgi:hypothetical protein
MQTEVSEGKTVLPVHPRELELEFIQPDEVLNMMPLPADMQQQLRMSGTRRRAVLR